MKDFNINSSIDTIIHQSIFGVIKDNWNYFGKQGTFRSIFNFEFCLYTCDSPPVCCYQLVYSIHEKNANTHIKVLEDNDWIYECVSHWDSLLLLAAKPRQAWCTNIKEFIWLLCVSYRSLNIVTRT